MKRISFIPLLFIACLVYGQQQGPAKWSYSVRQLDPNVLEIHLFCELADGWHIYSQQQPPTGIAVPTAFHWGSNPLVSEDGLPRELGTVIHFKEQKSVGQARPIEQNEYENAVEFVQTVRLKAAVRTNLAGSITYQVCTDKGCMRPVELPFQLALSSTQQTELK